MKHKVLIAIMVMLANVSVGFAQNDESVSFSSPGRWNLVVAEIGYAASTFSEPKLSGSYGWGMTVLGSMKGSKFGSGVHFEQCFNLGLVDSDWCSMPIKLGPAFAYRFKEQTFITLPVCFVCAVPIGDDASTGWGMEISPTVYLGKKWGIYFGPNISIPFSGGDVNCGFKAGIQI